MTDTTILVLSPIGVTPYSARGLTQTLQPIQGATSQRRTINGTLVDLSDSVFRKYTSTITGNDQQPPALDAVWPGTVLLVDCISELSTIGTIAEETDGTDQLFGKPHVPGSVRHDSGFTFYRPRLSMMVTGYSDSIDEWAAGDSWSLSLEEV